MGAWVFQKTNFSKKQMQGVASPTQAEYQAKHQPEHQGQPVPIPQCHVELDDK
jgi:hypothetical protein